MDSIFLPRISGVNPPRLLSLKKSFTFFVCCGYCVVSLCAAHGPLEAALVAARKEVLGERKRVA